MSDKSVWDAARMGLVAELRTEVAIAYWEGNELVREISARIHVEPARVKRFAGKALWPGRSCWKCDGALIVEDRSTALYLQTDHPTHVPACCTCSKYGWVWIEQLPDDKQRRYRREWLERHPGEESKYAHHDAKVQRWGQTA